ncbi:MAG TPA: hypothetical protein VNI54_04835 [Thermoanaerobaculia bacterium]|nr:hypothetical protein [Thermoanaerobaculia bacterium]
MAYDLLAVGGTGQSVLLELLYRAERSGMALLPSKIWILDRELDTWGDLIHVQKDLLPRQPGTQAPLIAITTARPAAPRSATVQSMSMVLNGNFEPPPEKLPATVASVIGEGLTPPEWNQNIEDGFFALPRLAAAWFGIVGLESKPEFLDGTYRKLQATGESRPLFVVGSVAGGTGAGLLPSLLHAFRLDPPRMWKREIWIFPFLPYFDPQASPRADKRINLTQCRWNASHAIQELERERALLHAQLLREVPDESERAQIPGTSISLIPPLVDNLAELSGVRPPEPTEISRRKFFDGAIGRGVDHILAVDAYLSNPQKALRADTDRTHLGVLQIPPSASGGATGYSGGVRNGIVAEMIRTYLDMVRGSRDAVRAIPGVIAGSGLGMTTERMFYALALPKGQDRATSQAVFWEKFDARLSERADAMAEPVQRLHTAQDLERIGKVIERYFGNENRRGPFLNIADANTPEGGTQAADRIVDALLSESETEAALVLRNTPHNAFAPAAVVGAVATSSFGQVPVFGEFVSPKEAASAWSARWQPVEDPHSFHGSSRAKLMGHAHAYADYVTNAPVGGGAPRVETPLGVAWVLWKAAVAGLLDFEEYPIGNLRGERWREAEDWHTDFGGHVVLMKYHGTSVAFSSADMGIVPAAQLSDRPSGAEWEADGKAKAALQKLSTEIEAIEKRRLDAVQASLADVLNAFSRRYASKGDVPPWQKLLQYEARAVTEADSKILVKAVVPSQRLWLRLKRGEPPTEVRIPLVIEIPAAVRRVAHAKADDPRQATSLLSWKNGILYYHEGEENLPLLHTCAPSPGGKKYVSRFTSELRRAMSALPDPAGQKNQPTLFELWPDEVQA